MGVSMVVRTASSVSARILSRKGGQVVDRKRGEGRESFNQDPVICGENYFYLDL